MSAAATTAGAVRPPLGRYVVTWVTHNLPTALVAAVGAGALAYVVNVWLMAVRYEGFAVPEGAPVTAEGNELSGALFWGLGSMLVLGVIGYRRRVGRERFWSDLRRMPSSLASLVRRDGAAARIHLLWGAAIGFLLGVVLSPSVGALVGVGLLALAPTLFGEMLSQVGSRIVAALAGRFGPGRTGPRDAVAPMAVALVGGAGSLLVAFAVEDSLAKLVLAALCAGLAVVLARSGRPGPVTPLAILAGLAAAALVDPSLALADDGGYAECGNSWGQWLDCPGSGDVLAQAAGGAVAAGLLAPPGLAIGDFLGAFGGRSGPLGQAVPPFGPPDGGGGAGPPDLGDVNARIGQMGIEIQDPTIYGDWKALVDRIRAQGGRFTPDDAATLKGIENAQAAAAASRRTDIDTQQQAATDDFRARQAQAADDAAAAARKDAAAARDAAAAQDAAARQARLDAMRAQQARREAYAASARRASAGWGALSGAADWVAWGSDRGVDLLAGLTGPAGKGVKDTYTVAKRVGKGIGEAFQTGDPTKVVKGTVEGVGDLGFSKFVSKSTPMNKLFGGKPPDPVDLQKATVRDLPSILRAGPGTGTAKARADAFTAATQSYARSATVRDPVKNVIDNTYQGKPVDFRSTVAGRDPMTRALPGMTGKRP